MKATLFASAVSTAAATSLSLSFKDCGAKHAVTKDVQPTTLELGAETAITGTGSLDKAVSGGTYDMELKAGGGLIHSHFTGNNCEAKEFKLPLGLGTLKWDGISCPLAAADSVKIGFHAELASALPAQLATSDIHVGANDQDGESVLCVDLHLAKQEGWEEFKAQYGKYYNGDDEEEKRHAIFDSNVKFINAENMKGHSYTLGVGPFADITAEEFKATRLGYSQPETEEPILDVHKWQGEELEDSIDWTTKGVVTPVKDQGQCGSCWAFSTTGALESGYALSSGKLVSLSEQQHVDCDGFPNMGCNGGQMKGALKWAMTHDSCSERSYAYTAKGGSCKSEGCDVAMPKGTVTGVKSLGGLLSKATDKDMMSALAQQPLSIAIEADQAIFQHYKSGVITGNCGTRTDHGVLLVGYGTDAGTDYWKVKNSWGASWGDHGFVRMTRGKNICGINSGPNAPQFGSTVAV